MRVEIRIRDARLIVSRGLGAAVGFCGPAGGGGRGELLGELGELRVLLAQHFCGGTPFETGEIVCTIWRRSMSPKSHGCGKNLQDYLGRYLKRFV